MKKNEKISKTIITQIIPTVQGEGPSIGTPVLLIRFGNCNLECEWCDTKWSNNLIPKTTKKFNKSSKKLTFPIYVNNTDNDVDDFINYINEKYLNKFAINTVLLTGGEPLINKYFIGKLIYNKETNLRNISKIEIETNGTLLNDAEDKSLFYHWDKIIQLNISPKLDPTYYRSSKITTVDDITSLFINNDLVSISKILKETPTSITWKFVHSKKDEENITKFIKEVPGLHNISIMPLTPDIKKYPPENSIHNEFYFLTDFRKSTYEALEYCMRTGYTLSPRAHVWIFNNYIHRDEFAEMIK